MAPQVRRDLRYPAALLERVETLARITGEDSNDLLRRAAAIGVAALESEAAAAIAFQNSQAVQAKLRRRGEHWEEAMALLQLKSIEYGLDGELEKAIELLKRSAGGE